MILSSLFTWCWDLGHPNFRFLNSDPFERNISNELEIVYLFLLLIALLSFQILSFPIPSSHSCKIASSFVGTPLKQRYITSQLPNGWLWLITFLHASKDVDWVRGDAQRSKWRWSFFAEDAGHGTVNFFCGVYIISGTDLQRGITLFYLYRSTDTLSVFFCKTFNSAL